MDLLNNYQVSVKTKVSIRILVKITCSFRASGGWIDHGEETLMKQSNLAMGILRHWDCHAERMDHLKWGDTENKKGNTGMGIIIERHKLFIHNYKITGKVQRL